MSLTTQLGQTIQGLVNMIALPAGYRLIEKLKTLLHPTASAKQEIYIVYGKQPSPYPDLSCIDPIIAVMTSEQDCYALEKLHTGIIISWETRTVQDDENQLWKTVTPFTSPIRHCSRIWWTIPGTTSSGS